MRTMKKRRREGKTDYRARLNLLKSGLPRIVVRKTNRYILVQYIKSKEARDFVIATVNSKELLKYGWPRERAGSLKSIPAAYLTGLLLGKKIKNKEGKFILDMGLTRNVKKSRIYAVLKGLIDSGIEVKYAKEKDIFPNNKRLEGEHLKNKIDFEKIKENILKK